MCLEEEKLYSEKSEVEVYKIFFTQDKSHSLFNSIFFKSHITYEENKEYEAGMAGVPEIGDSGTVFINYKIGGFHAFFNLEDAKKYKLYINDYIGSKLSALKKVKLYGKLYSGSLLIADPSSSEREYIKLQAIKGTKMMILSDDVEI